MADFSEGFAQEREKELNAEDPGIREFDASVSEDQGAEDKRIDGKFQSAYDGAGLSSHLPMDDYDYKKSFKDGNSFKPREEGGVILENRNVQPTAREIAGFDAATGERYRDNWSDNEGIISEGIDDLRKSAHDTITGAPATDVSPLSKIAQGIYMEGGSFDDFRSEVKGPWNEEQMALTWASTQYANEVNDDVNSRGERYLENFYDEKQTQEAGQEETPEDISIDPDTLFEDSTFMSAGKIAMAKMGIDTEGLEGKELAEKILAVSAPMVYNTTLKMANAARAVATDDKELAATVVYFENLYQNLEYSWAGARNFGFSLATDPINWMTYGGGILATRLASKAVSLGVINTMKAVMAGATVDATLGAGFSMADDLSSQTNEITAGMSDSYDLGRTGKAALWGGALTAGIGMPLNVAFSKPLRGVVAQGAKNTWREMLAGDYMAPQGPKSQRGSVGIPPEQGAPKLVEFKSRLEERINKEFGPTVSGKKLANKLKQWVAEDKRKPRNQRVIQEEIDWAGIERLDTATKEEVLAFIKYKRPEPSLSDPLEGQYFDYKIGNGEDYAEKLIGVEMPKVGPYQYPHFQDDAPSAEFQKDKTPVGHIRREMFENGKGYMFLEGQQDIKKEKFPTAMTKQAEKVQVAQTRKSHDDLVFQLAKKYKINVKDKNLISQVWAKSSTDEVSKLVKMEVRIEEVGKISDLQNIIESDSPTPFTPFRKSGSDLLFRSAIMDAINSDAEYLLWPKTMDQLKVIEKWDDSYVKSEGAKGASKFMLKEMPKLAKSFGFEIKEHIPDTKGNYQIKTKFDIEYFKTEEDLIDYVVGNWGIELEELGKGKTNIYQFDPEGELVLMSKGVNENNLLNELNKLTEVDDSSIVHIEPEAFSRIDLTPEVKEKFRKEGVSMYSFGAPAGILAGEEAKQKSKQKRDKDGRFK